MYRLPDFLRSAWVSDAAREAWRPRFEAIREAWPRVTLGAVAERKVECAVRVVPARMFFGLQADARRQGIEARVLGVRGVAVATYSAEGFQPRAGKPFLYEVAFGSGEVCAELEVLWRRREFGAAYRSAGAGDCCARALDGDAVGERFDPVGRYASAGAEVEEGTAIDALWSWLNVERVTCAACQPGCVDSSKAAEGWVGFAEAFGCGREMEWLREVLAWPVEWTALHGIAGLKTPVVKATWSTDPRHEKASLRYVGAGYPAEGGTGLRFPYRQQERRLVTGSSAFQRGMENLIQIG